MNFIHRAFYKEAARRAQLYAPSGSGPFSKLQRSMGAFRSTPYGFRGLGDTFAVPPSPRMANAAEHHRRFIGFGEETAKAAVSTAPGWLTQITDFAKQIVPVYQQTQLLREQAKRRAAGLPPLDPYELAPTVRVVGGVDPGIANMGKIALAVGGAVAAAMIAKTLMRR